MGEGQNVKSIEEIIPTSKKCFIMVWVKFVNGYLICYLQGRDEYYVTDIESESISYLELFLKIF